MANGTKKVLIVEDNADWRDLLKMIIKRSGYEVVVARTGEEGLALASLTHPDLILMDIGLPGMSGDQVTAQLKSNPLTKDIPVVVQTAYGAGPSTQRAIEAGAAEVIHKPISITDIQKVLTKYFTNGHGTACHPLEPVTMRQSRPFHQSL